MPTFENMRRCGKRGRRQYEACPFLQCLHTAHFELLHRQGKDKAFLRGRSGGGDRQKERREEGRKKTWVPETIGLVNVS